MKTEQEQIVAIADVLCDYCKNNTKIGEPCKSSNGTYICTSEIRRATALVEAGYGDVSEYKAEIKRLKAEFKQLETNAEILAQGVRDLNHENYELTEKVKQAQIDILNKLKDSYGLYYLSAFGVKERMLADILNPMIKELKK